MWATVENKQKFISQVMTSKSIARNCEDIDETVLSYAEVKALATGNPYIKEKIDVDNDVARLTLLKSTFDNHKYKMEDNFKSKYPKFIDSAKDKIKHIEEDIKTRNSTYHDKFEINIKGKLYDNREDAGTILKTIIDIDTSYEEKKLEVNLNGFEIYLKKQYIGCSQLILKGAESYNAEVGESSQGNIIRLENSLKNMENTVTSLNSKIEEYQRNLEQSKIEFEKTFEHEQLLSEKLKRQFELNELLDIGKDDVVEELDNESKDDELECRNTSDTNYIGKKTLKDILNNVEQFKNDIHNDDKIIKNNKEYVK